jgi:CRP/FNR family cyclic AMP-dependent transcriptional regulator
MANPDLLVDVRHELQATVFGSVGDAVLDEVCQMARVERFKVPTLLSTAGEVPDYLRLVVHGYIEAVARNALGEEFKFGFIAPGGWATWLNCFMDTAAEHDLYSGASACFIALPVTDVRALCDRHPKVYPLIIRQIGRRMRLLLEWTGQSVLVGPLQRMAKLLYVLALEQQAGNNRATLELTQARLASLARCSRQTANELLGQLVDKGLIIAAYRRFDVPDLMCLAEFADAEAGEGMTGVS